MDPLQVYVVEDDLITRAQIKTYLSSTGYVIAGESTNASTALEEIKRIQPDFAMLDINLSGEKNGLWLGQMLNELGTVPFIFLTARKDQETVEAAIELNPHGYLIKPFDAMSLYSAIELALKNYSKRVQGEKNDVSNEEEIVLKDRIFIKDQHLLIKLTIKDLLFVKSDGNYLELHLSDKKHVIRKKMSDFELQLSKEVFVRTHQRYLVNFSKIDSIGTNHVVVEEQEIPVSKNYRDELMNRVETF